MSKKRAEGLPINVIIIAIIGLIVLFILIAIFSKQSGNSVNVLESCQGRGGECRTENEGCKASEIKIPNAECSKDKPVCCKKIFG